MVKIVVWILPHSMIQYWNLFDTHQNFQSSFDEKIIKIDVAITMVLLHPSSFLDDLLV